MATEWGVKHSQGIRHEASKKSAEDALAWLTSIFEKSRRDRMRPVMVSREVTEWTEYTVERKPCLDAIAWPSEEEPTMCGLTYGHEGDHETSPGGRGWKRVPRQ